MIPFVVDNFGRFGTEKSRPTSTTESLKSSAASAMKLGLFFRSDGNFSWEAKDLFYASVMHLYVIVISFYVVLAAVYWLKISETEEDSGSLEKSQAQVKEELV